MLPQAPPPHAYGPHANGTWVRLMCGGCSLGGQNRAVAGAGVQGENCRQEGRVGSWPLKEEGGIARGSRMAAKYLQHLLVQMQCQQNVYACV